MTWWVVWEIIIIIHSISTVESRRLVVDFEIEGLHFKHSFKSRPKADLIFGYSCLTPKQGDITTVKHIMDRIFTEYLMKGLSGVLALLF